MSDRERDLLRAAMEEAVFLPPGDPVRLQVQEDVSRAGDWAEQDWLELVGECESLRIELRQVDVPLGLQAKLLLLPRREESFKSTRWSVAALFRRLAEGRRQRRLALSSLAFASVLLVMTLWARLPLSEEERRVQTLALLAMQDHLNENNLAVRSASPSEVEEGLSHNLGFPVHVPDLGGSYALVGGRPCHLGGHLVAFTLWHTPSGIGSVLQFKLAEFGIAGLAGKRVIRSHEPAAVGEPCQVTIWPYGPDGYALVERNGP